MQLRHNDIDISVHGPPCNPFPSNPKIQCGDRLARYAVGSTDMLVNDYYEIIHVGLDDGSYITIKRQFSDNEFEELKKQKAGE